MLRTCNLNTLSTVRKGGKVSFSSLRKATGNSYKSETRNTTFRATPSYSTCGNASNVHWQMRLDQKYLRAFRDSAQQSYQEEYTKCCPQGNGVFIKRCMWIFSYGEVELHSRLSVTRCSTNRLYQMASTKIRFDRKRLNKGWHGIGIMIEPSFAIECDELQHKQAAQYGIHKDSSRPQKVKQGLALSRNHDPLVFLRIDPMNFKLEIPSTTHLEICAIELS